MEILALLNPHKKEQLSALLTDLLEKETPFHPDLPSLQKWLPELNIRICNAMQSRNQALGGLNKMPATIRAAQKNTFAFLGAGMFIQSVMLALCAKDIVSVLAGETKKFLGIPSGRHLLLGMSIGYSDL